MTWRQAGGRNRNEREGIMADPSGHEIPWEWIVPLNTLFIAITAVGTWLFTRGGKEAVLTAAVTAAEAALVAQTLRAEKAEKAHDELMERLHAHMLADASAFAKLEAIAGEAARSGSASEVRLTAAIDKLVGRIDNMSEQFTGFVQRVAPLLSQPQHQQPQGGG